MVLYPSHLLRLMECFKKFPGIGSKTAERLAFELINWPDHQVHQFADLLKQMPQALQFCIECGALIDSGPCHFCDQAKRDCQTLCVVAFAKDLYLIDATRQYQGLYHVLGGVISPIDQLSLSDEAIDQLKTRLTRAPIKEIILALDSTLEGDATALYLKNALAYTQLPISRLAFGLPMGSSLDFIDGGTLSKALQARFAF